MRQYLRATVRRPLCVLVLLVTIGLLVGHHVGSAQSDASAGPVAAHETRHPTTGATMAQDAVHEPAEDGGAGTAVRLATAAYQYSATLADELRQEPQRGEHLHVLACLLALAMAVPLLRMPGCGLRPPCLSLDGPPAVAPRATTGRAVLLQRGVLRT